MHRDSEERRQKRNAEAHQRARLDPDRRQLEQERDTAAHQRVRQEDLEIR